MTRPLRILSFCAVLIGCGLMLSVALRRGFGQAFGFCANLLPGPSSVRASGLGPPRHYTSFEAPTVVFWAWERPEDLRFLAPGSARVAFLAKTIYLKAPTNESAGTAEASFSVRPRLQPLRIAAGTSLTAVVRIENPPGMTPWQQRGVKSAYQAISFSQLEHDTLASEIAGLQKIPGVSAIQIDFDAPASAHAFYAALLEGVRRELPSSFPLSITALASWCIGDRWLTKLPAGTIDEAVPMLFRMGRDGPQVADFLRSREGFPVGACGSSLGLSTDEAFSSAVLSGAAGGAAIRISGKRIYVFSPRSWSAGQAEEILKELQR